MISAIRQTKPTGYVGALWGPSRRQSLCPGIAPSRENANVIRDALVTHAIPQNSCPIVEISSTPLAAALVSAVSRIATAGKPALEIAEMWDFWTAKVNASSRNQPITAE